MRAALVVGGGYGSGRELVLLLAEAGAPVTLIARPAESSQGGAAGRRPGRSAEV